MLGTIFGIYLYVFRKLSIQVICSYFNHACIDVCVCVCVCMHLNGVLFSHKKGDIAICKNMDERYRHYTVSEINQRKTNAI